MTNEQMRKDFEAWAENFALDLTRVTLGDDGYESYSDCNTDYAWLAWQDRGSQQVPEGHVIVPTDPTQAMIVAIEQAIDVQLTASAIRPADMFRQDGEGIYRAMIAAAPAGGETGEG